MSKLKTYRVSFLDWTEFVAFFEATTARRAAALAEAAYEARGTEAFFAVDGAQEEFEIEEVPS